MKVSFSYWMHYDDDYRSREEKSIHPSLNSNLSNLNDRLFVSIFVHGDFCCVEKFLMIGVNENMMYVTDDAGASNVMKL